MSDGLKAFSVQEEDEGTGGIVFASSNVVARRLGANLYNDGEFAGLMVRRVAWADEYAPGPVPELVMVEHGWWFECMGCGVRIDESLEADNEDGTFRTLKPVELGHNLYCSDECHTAYVTDRAARKGAEALAAAALEAELGAKFPGVTIVGPTHVYVIKVDGIYAPKQVVVSFSFPGSTVGLGRYRIDEIGEAPHLTVCAGDKDAWDAWRESVAPGPHP